MKATARFTHFQKIFRKWLIFRIIKTVTRRHNIIESKDPYGITTSLDLELAGAVIFGSVCALFAQTTGAWSLVPEPRLVPSSYEPIRHFFKMAALGVYSDIEGVFKAKL